MELLLILAFALLFSERGGIPPQKLVSLLTAFADGKGEEALEGLFGGVRLFGMTPRELTSAAQSLQRALSSLQGEKGAPPQSEGARPKDEEDKADGGLSPISPIANEQIERMLGKYFA